MAPNLPTYRLASLLAASMLMAGIFAGLPPGDAATSLPTVKFGMESSSISAQTNAGVKPDYGTFWIGPWTLSSGWSGPDSQLANMKSLGVTPAVHFYYWGDDISPDCVENGCWSTLHNAQKDRAGWQLLAQQMVDHFNSKMGGAPVLVFLESEFNKGGIETYEPFDGYLAEKSAFIHKHYPAAQVVLGFGNWGSVYWGNFDRAAAASDMVGIQGMRGSTRQTIDQMYSLYDGLLAGIKTLEQKFPGKAKMITDIAVSSYPEPDYLAVQAGVLKEVFDNLGALKAEGVQAIIYRSWRDSPNMNTANYYGMAERYWGLVNSTSAKPSQAVWVDGVKAERAGLTTTPPAPSAIPIGSAGGAIEVDVFAARTAGGAQSDALASGGKMWNLWSNGYVAQSFDVAPGDYVVTVRARGTTALGVAPHMDVTMGGVPVISADPGTAYADHQVTRTIAGIVELRIAFTNDLLTSTEDRNLILDRVTFTRVASNQAPVASFQATLNGATLAVDASASTDADGDALTYAWSFGDGTTAVGALATHTYATGGSFTVGLSVTDHHGATATASKTVTVAQQVQVDGTGASLEVELMGTKSAGGIQADSLASGGKMWNLWSNGHVAQSFSVAPGEYVITVRARGTPALGVAPHMDVTINGELAIAADPGTAYADHSVTRALSGTVDIRISFANDVLTSTEDRNLILDTLAFTAAATNQAPVAWFTVAVAGTSATFDATASTDPDGDALSYDWSFGDGATASGAMAVHTYATAGTYRVVLAVTDARGATSTATQDVTIAPPPEGIVLQAVGYKVKGLQMVDLTWTGANSSLVDVYRNGVKVATTANDGAHTDSLKVRGGGSYSYMLCEAGTSTCSTVQLVSF